MRARFSVCKKEKQGARALSLSVRSSLFLEEKTRLFLSLSLPLFLSPSVSVAAVSLFSFALLLSLPPALSPKSQSSSFFLDGSQLQVRYFFIRLRRAWSSSALASEKERAREEPASPGAGSGRQRSKDVDSLSSTRPSPCTKVVSPWLERFFYSMCSMTFTEAVIFDCNKT